VDQGLVEKEPDVTDVLDATVIVEALKAHKTGR
jgi:hypothetical protein